MNTRLYDRYRGKITCAYNEDIWQDRNGVSRVRAKRTKEREKYIFNGFDQYRKPVLIECPPDILVLEFEGERAVNVAMVKVIELNLERLHLDYCIVDHGGTSPYIYIWNLKNLPKGYEAEAKKHIAKKLIPQLDYSNLGKTLIPVIGRPHWKKKYNGAVHGIVKGKPPETHINPVDQLLVDFVPPVRKNTIETDLACRNLKSRLVLSDVLQSYGMDVTRNPTRCLWHDSKNGQCFSFDNAKGVWHCFHCGKSGNGFHFIMIEEQCDFPTAKMRVGEMVKDGNE